jgi:hypothetical protein
VAVVCGDDDAIAGVVAETAREDTGQLSITLGHSVGVWSGVGASDTVPLDGSIEHATEVSSPKPRLAVDRLDTPRLLVRECVV